METALKITLTTKLTAQQMAPLWGDIHCCFQKYVDRFPDETIANMMSEVVSGKRQLWIVQDETGKVVLTPITEIVTVNATGDKILVFAEVGGERLRDALPLISVIEDWAVETHGVKEAQFPGRTGYRKILDRYGFKEKTVIFTKQLSRENNEQEFNNHPRK